MTRSYIIDPTHDRAATYGLMSGTHYFEARMVKNGPLVAIKTEVVSDDHGLDIDDSHVVTIDGRVTSHRYWATRALIGDEIDGRAYNYRLAASHWDAENLGLTPDKPVDLTTLPPIAPPLLGEAQDAISPELYSIDLACDTTAASDDGLIRGARLTLEFHTPAGVIFVEDTPAASALADAVLPPIDVEIEE